MFYGQHPQRSQVFIRNGNTDVAAKDTLLEHIENDLIDYNERFRIELRCSDHKLEAMSSSDVNQDHVRITEMDASFDKAASLLCASTNVELIEASGSAHTTRTLLICQNDYSSGVIPLFEVVVFFFTGLEQYRCL